MGNSKGKLEIMNLVKIKRAIISVSNKSNLKIIMDQLQLNLEN